MRTGVRGCVFRADITEPSNYRATEHLDAWLKARGIVAIAGVDTRSSNQSHPRERHAKRRHHS